MLQFNMFGRFNWTFIQNFIQKLKRFIRIVQYTYST